MGLPTSPMRTSSASMPCPKLAGAAPAKLWCEVEDVALRVCTLVGGPSAARHLAATCRVLHVSVADAWQELLLCFPRRLFVAGGLDSSFNPVQTVWWLDPSVGVWETLPPLPSPRAAPAAVLVQGQFFVLGGELDGDAISDVQRYDADSNCWQTLPPMSEGRIRPAVVASGPYIYVLGGLDSLRVLTSAERYDLRTGAWETLPPMRKPRYACAAAAQPLGRVLAFGGELTAQGCAASMECFDPSTHAWELLPPVVRTPACGAAMALAGAGKTATAFAMGGLGLSGQALPAAEWLCLGPVLAAAAAAAAAAPLPCEKKEDAEAHRLMAAMARVQTPTWSPLPMMPTPRHLANATGFGGGVVVVGGKGPTFEVADVVEAFDPVMNTWDSLPALPSPRFRVAVVSGRA